MPKSKTFHLPIAVKAVLLIAALGLLSIAANAFCLQRLDAFDKLNAVVTRHFAPARLALAEAKAAIESFGVATYKSYSASDPDQANETAEEIEGHYAAAKRALNNVLTYYPAAGGDVRRIFEKLELAHTIAVNLKGALKAGNKDQAKRIVDFKFDPARDDVTGHMDRLINILGAQTRSAEAEVAERSAWTFRTTVGILVGGTIAALVVAFLLTQLFLTRPLRGMARAMTRMAEGDLGVPVQGSHRADEIGAMARAVAVFRNNAMALRDAELARAAERKRSEREKSAALEAVAAAFESDILAIAASIGHAATELEAFARGMAAVLDESHRHVRKAAAAAEDTTSSATSVASAIEELSASISDIGTQVASSTMSDAPATWVPMSEIEAESSSIAEATLVALDVVSSAAAAALRT